MVHFSGGRSPPFAEAGDAPGVERQEGAAGLLPAIGRVQATGAGLPALVRMGRATGAPSRHDGGAARLAAGAGWAIRHGEPP
jgi:hypothetical protein